MIGIAELNATLSRFDTILACYGQTDRHLVTAQSALHNA